MNLKADIHKKISIFFPILVVLLFVAPSYTYHPNIAKYSFFELGVVIIAGLSGLLSIKVGLRAVLSILFILVCIVSALMCDWRIEKIYRFFQMTLLIPFTFTVSQIVRNDDLLVSRVREALFLCVAIASTAQMFMVVKMLILSQPQGGWDFIGYFYMNIRQEAHYLSPILLMTVILLIWKKLKGYKFYLALVFACIFGFLLLYFCGRTSIAATWLGFLFLIVYSFIKKQNQKETIVYSSIVTVASLVLFYCTMHINTLWQRLVNRSTLSNDTSNAVAQSDALTSGRVSMWSDCLDLLYSSPVYGAGPDSYRYDSYESYGEHAHSVIFQYLAEWGILGTGLLFTLVFVVLYVAVKRLIVSKKYEYDTIINFIPLCALLLISLTSGVFYVAQSLFLCAIFAGLLISREYSRVFEKER